MEPFRLRLILALVVCVTAVSMASTYFDVLAHRHILREELERRAKWMGMSVLPEMEQAIAGGNSSALPVLADQARVRTGALGVAVYDTRGTVTAFSGAGELISQLAPGAVEGSLRKGTNVGAFAHSAEKQWLEESLPLHDGSHLQGALVLVLDAGYIREQVNGLWWQSFWRVVMFVLLIAGVTLLMVRWFLMRPMMKVAERLRSLRLRAGRNGHAEGAAATGLRAPELSMFSPLAKEVETMAESLIAARAAAATEARLRDAGEHVWTAERLAVHMRERAGTSRIFAVSNREPYVHLHQGRGVVCSVPPSGLVTAIEPVLRACDGVWVACGNGDADAETVDAFDRLRVPPDDPRYTLRRVWLSEEEEARYYEGFSNEGLWPLCHIAHTRPIFRAADWECYRRVNARFASALLEEMEGSENPLVLVQDYHLALVPQMVKSARPDARVAIFWHIPWPNPEAFGICPWQPELLNGLLGADLIGFHIPLHCNNFLATVDREVEARSDHEHMTVRRRGHLTRVRPYPVSVAFEGPGDAAEDTDGKGIAGSSGSLARLDLLEQFGVKAEKLALGVDRLDYTKGIVERMVAMERLLEEHPWHLERLTLVQIAAPSRTRISSYIELRRKVEESAERINRKFQMAHWRPIVLIERQCSHEEVEQWYRAADVCVVTSLHDGMNLVAKEFVASREDEAGVLVLSKFTGAAVELHDALVVNPYDIGGVAEAIHLGLEMNGAEARTRMRRMRRQVMEFNIYRWAARLLGDLREIRLENEEGAETGFTARAEGVAEEDMHRKLA